MDILIVDDEKIIRDAVGQLAEDAGHYAEYAASGSRALEMLREAAFDLVILDLRIGAESGLDVLAEMQKRFPNVPVVLSTAAGNIATAVEAMRRGAMDFLEKPFTSAQLQLVLARAQKNRRLVQRVEELKGQVSSHAPEPTFTSENARVQKALGVLFRAAPTTASILILGESGVGKSMIARAVHQRSPRADKPFVTVNCPSLSKELLESELFGHTKGSFTGAVRDHWGKVKAAEGGTLFLDEIGELPLEIQPKLLRLLQDREYERVGENQSRTADVRMIAATNRDLAQAVKAGTFREDLYHRLNVITVEIPPLRDRPEDLMRFADEYLRFFGGQFGRAGQGFAPAAQRHLLAYSWPGNLRELRNSVERAVILATGPAIEPEDLPGALSGASDAAAAPGVPKAGDFISIDELETAHLRAILARTPSLTAAAEVLGIDQATLYRKRKRLNLDAEGASAASG